MSFSLLSQQISYQQYVHVCSQTTTDTEKQQLSGNRVRTMYQHICSPPITKDDQLKPSVLPFSGE